MVCGNASLEATIATVFRTAEDVLQYCPGCSSRTADLSAQAMFGRDLEVTDVQHPRVIITTALADRNPPALELICNYKPSGTRQWKVWEAARATSAAPMYFEEHFYDRFVDGGTMANNHKHLMQW